MTGTSGKAVKLSMAMLAALMFTPQMTNAQTVAGKGPVLKINAEGKQICRDFAASGETYWSGKVRATFPDGYYHPTSKFTVRTCFKTEKECSRFVNGIEHLIYPIEFVFFANCKPKG